MDCNPTVCREKLITRQGRKDLMKSKVDTIAFRFY